jgi:hypothetical protein
MNLIDILNLPDDTGIAEVTLTIASVNETKPKSLTNPAWGNETFCQAFDATGKIGVIIQQKKPKFDPQTIKGKTIHLKAWNSPDRGFMGLRLKHKGAYKNLIVTDTADIKILGEGTSAPSAASASKPTASATPTRASFPSQLLTPEETAKHLASEWCAVYDWTKDIFETRLDAGAIREVVTGVVIEMHRKQIDILPYTDRKIDWKNYVLQGTKLGDLPPEKIKNGYILSLQGKFKNLDTCQAFDAAFKDSKLTHRELFGYWLNKEGIDDESSDSILLRDFQSNEDMDDAMYQTVLSRSDFFEEAKKLQASKKTPFDDEDTVAL